MEGYGEARHTTDNNVIWRMRFESLANKAAATHSELTHQTTYTLNKIQFMTSINLLQVSAPEFYPQGLRPKTVYD